MGLGNKENSGLAYLVMIRSEKDPVKRRQFNPSQRKIWLDWRKKNNQNNEVTQYLQEKERDLRVKGFMNALRATGNVVEKR